MSTNIMTKKVFGSIAVASVLLFAAAAVVSQPAEASSNKYNFTARVIVTDVDQAEKTFNADVVKVEGRGKDDMGTRNIEFAIDSKAKIFKVASGKDKAVTYKNIAIGQELGIKGYAKADDDDTFVVNFVRIQERNFSVVGLLESMDKTAKTMKISIISSTYKPTSYKKGKEITVTYDDDSTFYENNAERAVGDINADAQKVKLTGVIKDANTWYASKIWNKYKANK